MAQQDYGAAQPIVDTVRSNFIDPAQKGLEIIDKVIPSWVVPKTLQKKQDKSWYDKKVREATDSFVKADTERRAQQKKVASVSKNAPSVNIKTARKKQSKRVTAKR